MESAMFPVLTLAHNNIELTKRCVASIKTQDIPGVEVFVIDNDSTDGTRQWMVEWMIPHARFSPQLGVSAGWNYGLDWFFRQPEVEQVMVIGNDTYLPSNFYREMMGYSAPFITGIADYEAKDTVPGVIGECPDFSAFLITRNCWVTVGTFDDTMKLYASDCDYHVRAQRMQIPLFKVNVPFGHDRSATLRNAPLEERRALEDQAHKDRERFKTKWGCLPGTPEYTELLKQPKPPSDRPTLVVP
jgi:hypothetical protein